MCHPSFANSLWYGNHINFLQGRYFIWQMSLVNFNTFEMQKIMCFLDILRLWTKGKHSQRFIKNTVTGY